MEETQFLKNRLREHRGRLNMTQGDLADEIGTSRNTIGNIEAGKHEPGIITALRIAAAFGVTVNEVFEIK